jgi:hypothetical protein
MCGLAKGCWLVSLDVGQGQVGALELVPSCSQAVHKLVAFAVALHVDIICAIEYTVLPRLTGRR